MQPATKDNFDFQPGDISRLDDNGNVIPDDEWGGYKDYGPDCEIDNSHLTDTGLDNFDESEPEDRVWKNYSF